MQDRNINTLSTAPELEIPTSVLNTICRQPVSEHIPCSFAESISSPVVQPAAGETDLQPLAGECEERISVWNYEDQRIIAGSRAPKIKNLLTYFEKHPECELYVGQNRDESQARNFKGKRTVEEVLECLQDGHSVTLWDSQTRQKISGRAAPLKRNLARYLEKYPHRQVYVGQCFNEAPEDETDDETVKVRQESERVDIWNPVSARRITGNARPMKKHLKKFFQRHPTHEIYREQDKCSAKRPQESEEHLIGNESPKKVLKMDKTQASGNTNAGVLDAVTLPCKGLRQKQSSEDVQPSREDARIIEPAMKDRKDILDQSPLSLIDRFLSIDSSALDSAGLIPPHDNSILEDENKGFREICAQDKDPAVTEGSETSPMSLSSEVGKPCSVVINSDVSEWRDTHEKEPILAEGKCSNTSKDTLLQEDNISETEIYTVKRIQTPEARNKITATSSQGEQFEDPRLVIDAKDRWSMTLQTFFGSPHKTEQVTDAPSQAGKGGPEEYRNSYDRVLDDMFGSSRILK